MEVSPLIYIALLVVIILGPVLANISYYGWKKPVLSRIFLLVSAACLVIAMILFLF